MTRGPMSPLKKWMRSVQRAAAAKDVGALNKCIAVWEAPGSPRQDLLAPAGLRCAAVRFGLEWMWHHVPCEEPSTHHLTAFWSRAHGELASGLINNESEARLIALWELVKPSLPASNDPWNDYFEDFCKLRSNKHTLSLLLLTDLLPHADSVNGTLKTPAGATPLEVAFDHQNFLWLQTLLDAGANPSLVTASGWSLVQALADAPEYEADDWQPVKIKVNQVLLESALPAASGSPRPRM